MRTRIAPCSGKMILRTVAAIALASVSAACSSDSARFGDNPFTNPFGAAAKSTPAPTARAVQGADRVMTGSLPSRTMPVSPVSSQPLPSVLSRAPQVPASPVVSARPVQQVASSTLQNVTAAPITGSAAGWSANGGTPITVGPGETAQTLSSRYGVPAAAISAANGGQVVPGRQAIIPVYAPGAQAAPARAINPITNPAPIAQPVAAGRPVVQSAPQAIPQAAKPVTAAKPAPDDDDEDDAPAAPKVTPAAPKPVAAILPAKPVEAAKPIVAAKPVAAAQPVPGRIVAAKPVDAKKPVVAAAKPVADDEDEDDAPEKPAKPVVKAPEKRAEAKPVVAPSPKPKPAVVAVAKPVERKEEPQKSEPVTTQSIPAPAEKPVAPAASGDDKPEFRWPAKGRVISGFGTKGANGDGIAIALPEGTPVKAAEGGTVAYAGEELKGYGKLVLVRHDNGYVSAYAHNGDLNVKRGDKVSRGQTIAKSGATGNVTSPQLHFELRKGSTPVDPTKYLD